MKSLNLLPIPYASGSLTHTPHHHPHPCTIHISLVSTITIGYDDENALLLVTNHAVLL